MTHRRTSRGGRRSPIDSRGGARTAGIAGAVGLVVLLLAGCAREGGAEARVRSTAATSAEIPEVLATIGDESVTLGDLPGYVAEDLGRLELQYNRHRHQILEEALEEHVRERILREAAARRGVTPDQLLTLETGGALEPTEQEVLAWYEENQARLGGRPLDQIAPQIAQHLRETRRTAVRQDLVDRLYAERGVVIHLEPFRLTFDNSRAPAKGPETAPVTLVEFSDFQCSFCARFAPTLHRLEEEFGDRLRIVYRHFPLTNIHPHAFKAAEASMCAHEQGEFWAMHDLIFAEQDRVTLDDLKQKAGRLGLHQQRFDSCLDTGRYTRLVEEDIREGQRAGVQGTPALFINGVQLEGGAVPFETVAEGVRRELGRVGG